MQISAYEIEIYAFICRYLYLNTWFDPKVRGRPSKLSFLLSDFNEIRPGVTYMFKSFGIVNKDKQRRKYWETTVIASMVLTKEHLRNLRFISLGS